jgi:uncharacterized membrane protein
MENNFDRDIANPDNYKLSIFYCNPNDSRIIVPKQNKYLGWTLNFGHSTSYLLLAGIVITAVFCSLYF